jgi:hypothetical protein
MWLSSQRVTVRISNTELATSCLVQLDTLKPLFSRYFLYVFRVSVLKFDIVDSGKLASDSQIRNNSNIKLTK